MREMKDSGIDWVGAVPSSWEIKRVKNIAKLRNGSDPKTEGTIPVYGSGSSSFKTCGEYKEGPTVLLGRKGATLHIPSYIEGAYWNVDTAFDVVMRDDNSLRFFYYLATCFNYGYYLTDTALPSMTQSDYGDMKVAIPEISEQLAIAAYLDARCTSIDEAVARHRMAIDKLEEYRRAVITKTVTKGLDPDAPMKDSGYEWIGDIPRHWTIMKLGYFSSSVLGKMLDQRQETGINIHRYLSNKDVQWFLINVDNLSTTSFPENSQLRYGLERGDILICEGGEVGRCAIWDEDDSDVYFQKALHRLRVRRDIAIPEFIAYQIHQKAFSNKFIEVRKGEATIAHLPGDQLRQLKFVLPSLDEQIDIVAYLDYQCAAVDDAIDRQHRIIDKLEEYRRSLIHAAVTGRIDCTKETL